MEDKDVPEDVALDELLRLSQVDIYRYNQALHFTKSSTHIVLQRQPSEGWINQCNPDILHAWKGNMDLQFITNPYSCIAYVASNMLKSERSMSELLKKVAEESRRDDIKSKLKKVGSALLNNREVSAQEAAYRLLSLPLKRSRTVVFVNTAPKEKRVSMLKPLSVLQDMPDDDENIFRTSLLDRYSSHPHELENICLAEFAANYTTGGKEVAADDHVPDILDNDNADTKGSTTITLLNGLGIMRKRKREVVIRFHKEKSDGEEKYRGLLMLYHPWRNEEQDIMHHHASYEEHYTNVKDSMDANEIERAFDDLDRFGPPEHAWDAVAPGAEHEQAQQVRTIFAIVML